MNVSLEQANREGELCISCNIGNLLFTTRLQVKQKSIRHDFNHGRYTVTRLYVHRLACVYALWGTVSKNQER